MEYLGVAVFIIVWLATDNRGLKIKLKAAQERLDKFERQ